MRLVCSNVADCVSGSAAANENTTFRIVAVTSYDYSFCSGLRVRLASALVATTSRLVSRAQLGGVGVQEATGKGSGRSWVGPGAAGDPQMGPTWAQFEPSWSQLGPDIDLT